MSKPKKILIISLSVLLVLAAVGLSVAFTLNTVKFSVMSADEFSEAQKVFSARQESEDPIKFIAHRGLSSEAFQNTEKAFLLAAEDSDVWGIETDVWMTKDGGIVCMHDANALDGISNVRNATLAEATATPLRNNKNEYAPTIETYLNICKTYGKVAVVELKDKKITADDISKILAAIDESGAQATVISFHYDLLKIVREQAPDMPLQALTVSASFISKAQIEELIDMRCDLSAYGQFLTKTTVDKFHDAKLKVGIWTINSRTDAVCFASELGIDYITTDERPF